MTDEYMRIGAVAKLFDVTVPTVRQWVRDGRLRSTMINHRHLFKRSDVEALIEERSG